MIIKSKIIIISKFLILLFFCARAYAYIIDDGIILQSTRIIYPSNENNGVTFKVTNKTANDYLLQSRVLAWQHDYYSSIEIPESNTNFKYRSMDFSEKSVPFIALPPLTRFDSGEVVTLHVRLTEQILPDDRESLFMLAIKAIPGQSVKESETQTSLVLALQNNLKLFYRPQGIVKLDVEARAEKLDFYYQDKQLIIKNPTPYYITFSVLKADDSNVDFTNKRMLAPYSLAQYPLSAKVDVISWMIIDDDGDSTKVRYRKLN